MRIHFIGINGASMSNLALISKNNGHTVSGSDLTLHGHDAKNVQNAELVVYSSAINEDNCELLEARRLNIPTISRADYLSKLSKEYGSFFAVCGCHGKTTTTTMLYHALSSLSPTLHVGAKTEIKPGKKKIFISEACEYKKSFLSLRPDFSVFTNVDYDHPDCYKNLSELKDAYLQFYKQCGTSFINADDKHSKFLLKRKNTISYGFSDDAEFVASSLRPTPCGYVFDVSYKSHLLSSFTLNVKGRHNVYNALGSIACAFSFGMSKNAIRSGIMKFEGVKRRNEFLGKIGECDVYTDYAHHPTEIINQLTLLTSFYKSTAVVFQPHTYSRTANLLSDFAYALTKADCVILLPTFASREKGEDDDKLYNLLKTKIRVEKIGKNEANEWTKNNSKNYACICYMGAGDIDNEARKLF
ncbi:MAG: UDP-N-acetylmuramate--L-alanine ligase [Clostridia bacterium]|nr:UDP-N-acetylmuramate--L-alanine ligase [Clostridia bacterium]